ncbi:HGxxPAAW family protein [Streptomyces sp. MA15]|uniref:HGxxPAAW family protein n=1 Tax=unclassified Streptomyces TaxID=2593676 RepID=UPI0025AFBF7C|nr:HGxxPAAW family protein [Streptomyces sp. MA15]MDN3266455.1 HGxxPAAW family protein [Streptomyces sp. MA15]
MSAHPYDHGHTVAGWTGCGIAVAGAAVLGAGVCAVSGPLLLAGAAVEVVALLVTWALHLAGWGKPSGPRPRQEWSWRVRDSGARAGHAECVGCRLAGRRGGPVGEPAPVTAPTAAPAVSPAPAAPVEADPVGAGS